MVGSESRAYEPSDAEVVRSVLRAATSLTAVANGSRHELLGSDIAVVERTEERAEERAELRLRVPLDSRLAREAAMVAGEGGGLPVALEWTDVAPLAVRQRIRARVRIAGMLSSRGRTEPEGMLSLPVDVRHVALATPGADGLVDPAELLRAEPDPLAVVEAALLLHLAEDHQGHVAALLGLIDPQLLYGVTEVSPLALDRYGIVLRLSREWPGGRRHAHPPHQDVRLSFGEPLPDADQVGRRLHALLAGHGEQRPAVRRD
ncbi:DUF2470 domain-containing protein [Streptacidiphilus cavernicola]|uniref:DUF2470 domain-containing protein n=1 Tax=Streptacidiphilus cavernicola TaxID=3342716 RepID=A0ABV6W3D6_9ACTN